MGTSLDTLDNKLYNTKPQKLVTLVYQLIFHNTMKYDKIKR